MNAPAAKQLLMREDLQKRAANPTTSVWVNASAGTGKTRVLVDRVLRLLLADVKPWRILCLTFTKAAAAEMATRLTDELGKWAVLPDDELSDQIFALTHDRLEPEDLARARTLFAGLLDAPGGLQISTLHGFCQSLLARFPLEAGVAPGFQVLDERLSQQLLETAERAVLTTPQPATQAALHTLLQKFARGDFTALLKAAVSNRMRIAKALDKFGGVAGVAQQLQTELGIKAGATTESLLQRFATDEARNLVRDAANILAGGSTKTDLKNGPQLLDWLGFHTAERIQNFANYQSVFLTNDLEPRKNLMGAALAKEHPAAHAVLLQEQEIVLHITQQLLALDVFTQTTAFMTVAADLLSRYAQLKAGQMALDYDDLIEKAVQLVSQQDGASWVMFKLDGGLDHILVDEAQDTNPTQWKLVLTLAREFYNSREVLGRDRTMFAVGDFKQSIYSFQGAEPASFLAARTQVQAMAQAYDLPFENIVLTRSYRSVKAVLQVVDKVFEGPAAEGVVPPDERPLVHEPARKGMAGHVEVWPLLAPQPAPEAEAWQVSSNATADEAPAPPLLAAQVLAEKIDNWVKQGEVLPSRGTPLQYGDFLILVRKRGPFVEAFIREAKKRKIPISGADRMKLLEQLVVEDLLALCDFLLLPEDDLTLATVLKGPLLGISEEELFALAHQRGKATLWERLRQHEPLSAAAQYLSDLRNRADMTPPYALLTRILTQPCPTNSSGRKAMLTRLGVEAADPLDELLASALNYERTEAASLQGFLLWLRRSESEIKRELEQAGGQVRVMTVHGAKGLQAPVVILADAAGSLTTGRGVTLLTDKQDEAAIPLLAAGVEDVANSAWTRLKEARKAENAEEYRRLLYVALTRAEDRLYVVGWRGRKAPTLGNWHILVSDALNALTITTPTELATGWSGDVLALTTAQEVPPSKPKAKAASTFVATALPAWALQTVEAPLPTTKPLSPSQPDEDEPAVLSPLDGDDTLRYRRGTLIHRLLQTLPDVPPAEREAAALQWLAGETHAKALAHEVLQVLNDPRFAPIFSPTSRAEVPLVGQVGKQVVAGQIDRLAITDDAVWVVDYKSNRPPATTPETVPAIYLKQLAAYRAVLARVYPDKPIRTFLLWTFRPELMEIPAALLDPHTPSPHIE